MSETAVERRLCKPLGGRVHHGWCPAAQAWDVNGVPCHCPPGWPRWVGLTEDGRTVYGKRRVAALLARCEGE